ncbi:MAG: cytochrome C oxidase subunit IV family protein [Mycobacteriales bacterium]
MNHARARRLLGAWVALCALTLGYLLVDRASSRSDLEASEVVTIGAILIALTKIRIIMREFMEVRHAARGLGLITDGCIALMAITLLGCYLIGRGVG